MRLVIALFKVDTQATQYLSIASRINNVAAAVASTKAYTENLGTPFWKDLSALRAIFLAPEYTFARSLPNLHADHGPHDRRQMDEEYVKNKLRPVFGEISAKFRNAMIVPGSIAWRKSLIPATAGRHGSPLEVQQYRRRKYGQRLQDAVNVNMPATLPCAPFAANTPVFPPAFRRGGDDASVATAADKLNVLEHARYIAKNTAHCYYNGDCIYKYNKIGDYYEVSDHNPEVVQVPNRDRVSGTSVGAGRFRSANLDFGISICYDQSLWVQNSRAQTVEPLQSTASPVDFHILLSACMNPFLQMANLKPGGYLLSCSSHGAWNQVIRSSGDVLVPDSTESVGGSSLDFYKLE